MVVKIDTAWSAAGVVGIGLIALFSIVYCREQRGMRLHHCFSGLSRLFRWSNSARISADRDVELAERGERDGTIELIDNTASMEYIAPPKEGLRCYDNGKFAVPVQALHQHPCKPLRNEIRQNAQEVGQTRIPFDGNLYDQNFPPPKRRQSESWEEGSGSWVKATVPASAALPGCDWNQLFSLHVPVLRKPNLPQYGPVNIRDAEQDKYDGEALDDPVPEVVGGDARSRGLSSGSMFSEALANQQRWNSKTKLWMRRPKAPRLQNVEIPVGIIRDVITDGNGIIISLLDSEPLRRQKK